MPTLNSINSWIRSRLAQTTIVALVIVGMAIPAVAGNSHWLHVRVVEEDPQELVKINIPLSLVEAFLPAVDNKHFRRGQIELVRELRREGIDIEKMWEALRDSPNGDFVTVESKDERVRITKQDHALEVRVEGDDENVEVNMPWSVLEAAFSGKRGSLDLQAALEELARHEGSLVSVNDGESSVRIWIDDVQNP